MKRQSNDINDHTLKYYTRDSLEEDLLKICKSTDGLNALEIMGSAPISFYIPTQSHQSGYWKFTVSRRPPEQRYVDDEWALEQERIAYFNSSPSVVEGLTPILNEYQQAWCNTVMAEHKTKHRKQLLTLI